MATSEPPNGDTPTGKARAFGRSLTDFPDRNDSEEELIAAARRGEFARIGDSIPKDDDKDRTAKTIRAGLVRFLALGGDEATPVHEQGVQIRGAVIDGVLDFEGCTLVGDLILWFCDLIGTLILRGARVRTVNLGGSHCRDIEADGLVAAGGVLFRNRFEAEGVVRLVGADIKTNLECIGGLFKGRDSDGDALVCHNMRVGGEVSVNYGFAANGAISLIGAEIGSDVGCMNGIFGALPKESSSAEGSTTTQTVATAKPTKWPLKLSRATVKGTLWLDYASDAVAFHGGVDLTGASINRIVDKVTARSRRRAPDATPAGAGDSPCFLGLDGLTYARFGEPTNLSASARIAFLRLQTEHDLSREFKPQPWMKMVKVLREMGHTDAAREVAIAYEDAKRKAGTIKSKIGWILHRLYGVVVGYGHRPMRLLNIAAAIWLLCGLFYHYAAVHGVFAPSSPLVFQNPAYAACRFDYVREKPSMPAKIGNWYWCKPLRPEYSAFNPYLYSLDLILPLVDLQQDKDWGPIIPTPRQHDASQSRLANYWLDIFSSTGWSLGHWVRVVLWFEILFGWVASLLFVSVAAGFIKRMDSE